MQRPHPIQLWIACLCFAGMGVVVRPATSSGQLIEAIDPWPALEDAVRAAAQPILTELENEVDRRTRRCVLESENEEGSSQPGLVELVRLAFAEKGFVCVTADAQNAEALSRIRFRHDELPSGGVVTLHIEDRSSSGTARYLTVPWASGAATPVTRRGDFLVVMAASSWHADRRSAQSQARDCAARLLCESRYGGLADGTPDDESRAARLLAGRTPDAFQQTRRLGAVTTYRTTSRYVLPIASLHVPDEPSATTRRTSKMIVVFALTALLLGAMWVGIAWFYLGGPQRTA
ncbi:MAG: hypothetical protein ACYTG0_12030 [Planctomycetota bacterium]|jgi:hypothetical protein